MFGAWKQLVLGIFGSINITFSGMWGRIFWKYLCTLIIEVAISSETSVYISYTTKDDLHSHHRENLQPHFYINFNNNFNNFPNFVTDRHKKIAK
jgi:hypothetical protein